MLKKPNEKAAEPRGKPTIYDAASVFVATCALLLSTYQGCQTREHDKLSMAPHILVEFDMEADGAGWVMRNLGVGPAEIRGFSVLVDGNAKSSWTDVLNALDVHPASMMFAIPYPGTSIRPAGDTTKLLWLPPAFTDALKKNADRIQMDTVYCSMYKDCWTVSTKIQLPEKVSYPDNPHLTLSHE